MVDDGYDDDQRDSEVLLLLLLVVSGHRRRGDAAHLPPLPHLLLERHDQLRVEKRQQDERAAEHHDKVADVVVQNAEDRVRVLVQRDTANRTRWRPSSAAGFLAWYETRGGRVVLRDQRCH